MRSFTLFALLLVGLHAIHAEEVPSVVSHSVEHAPVAAAPGGPISVLVGEQPQQPGNQVVGVEHVHHQQVASGVEHAQLVPTGAQYSHQANSAVSYYAQQPAGVISVVGGGQHQVGSIVNKHIGQQYQSAAPVQPVGHYAASQVLPSVGSGEQYGQPEPASIPANYKPFGSWGLYIGGNPADGYYTNYYKSLGSSVEKFPVGSSEVAPAGGQQVVNKPVGVSSGGPMLRQAVGPAYVPADGVYAYDHAYYTPADLASSQPFSKPSSYETPSASFNPSSSMLSYADQSATKRLVQQQQVPVVQQQQSPKGYQSRSGYFYSQVAPVQQQVFQQQAPQVLAYPVPVGSQIVGSQPGVEGAYYPYGVHAFTRYAIKPTVVASNEVLAASPTSVGQQYYSKSQQQQQVAAPHYFYGYPLSQLHYAAEVSPLVGSPVSGRSSVVEHQEAPHHSAPVVGEASNKLESVSHQDKPVIDKQQKRA